MNYKKIILVGPGASGKDYARELLVNKGYLKFGCTCTTRPKRNYEIEGKDYYFISKEEFLTRLNNNEFYTWMAFKDGEWYYGRLKKDFYDESVRLIIMAPGDIKQILPEDRKDCLIIYFNIPEHIRKSRLGSRNDADIVERRLDTDRKDFENFNEYDIEVCKENFIFEDLLNLLITN
jgi:guanylate kinase